MMAPTKLSSTVSVIRWKYNYLFKCFYYCMIPYSVLCNKTRIQKPAHLSICQCLLNLLFFAKLKRLLPRSSRPCQRNVSLQSIRCNALHFLCNNIIWLVFLVAQFQRESSPQYAKEWIGVSLSRSDCNSKTTIGRCLFYASIDQIEPLVEMIWWLPVLERRRMTMIIQFLKSAKIARLNHPPLLQKN